MAVSRCISASKGSGRLTQAGRPKDMSKRAAILEAAKLLFTEFGYDGASMDAIAARAGVSKLTVYSHFGDKETLFIRSVEALCGKWLPDELFVVDCHCSLRQKLLDIGRLFLTLASTESALATQRTLIAPKTSMQLRQLFWRAGPRQTEAALADLLAQYAARGAFALPLDHPDQAAKQFLALLRDEIFACLLGNACASSSLDAIERHVISSVDFFLRAYAPDAGAACGQESLKEQVKCLKTI